MHLPHNDRYVKIAHWGEVLDELSLEKYHSKIGDHFYISRESDPKFYDQCSDYFNKLTSLCDEKELIFESDNILGELLSRVGKQSVDNLKYTRSLIIAVHESFLIASDQKTYQCIPGHLYLMGLYRAGLNVLLLLASGYYAHDFLARFVRLHFDMLLTFHESGWGYIEWSNHVKKKNDQFKDNQYDWLGEDDLQYLVDLLRDTERMRGDFNLRKLTLLDQAFLCTCWCIHYNFEQNDYETHLNEQITKLLNSQLRFSQYYQTARFMKKIHKISKNHLDKESA